MRTTDYKKSRAIKRCRECGVKEEGDVVLTVHHLLPQSHGGANTEENFILLCRECHDDFEDGSTDSGFKIIL